LLCLINQANYLLDKQIEALEAQFIEEGGYSEQLAVARLAERNRKKNGDPSDPSDRSDRKDPIPSCPKCGKPMALRTAQKGKQAGKQFWGCSGYPECKGLVDI
jgi:four helix bundle suffix protein